MLSAIPYKSRLLTILMGIIFLATGFFLPDRMKTGWWTGYLIGLLTVLLHLIASYFTLKGQKEKFISNYYAGIFIRFFLVCGVFILILIMTKIDEFSFTVSFIISYLLHSINEVIFLNQKLSD